jgi:putative ABC transport system permease protein
MLMGETLWNSLVALAAGLPLALFLTELISLVTVKLVGLGILGHQFRISWPGLLGTIAGFLAVQLVAMIVLSIRMSKKELIELLKDDQENVQEVISKKTGLKRLVLGLVLLAVAYCIGILFLNSLGILVVWAILISGIAGTFLVFQGLSAIIGRWVKRKIPRSTGLFAFTGRQLQESVLHQSAFLSIASLLVLMAIIALAFGVSTALGNGNYTGRMVDISLQGEQQNIEKVLNSDEVSPYIKAYYPMNLSGAGAPVFDKFGKIVNDEQRISWTSLIEGIESLPQSSERNNLVHNLAPGPSFLISLSSYNNLLESMNEEPIKLDDGEMAFYTSETFGVYVPDLQKVLNTNPEISFENKTFTLISEIQTANLVADRYITILFALIVPDEVYHDVVGDEPPFCWNVVLDEELVREKGLMQALLDMDGMLQGTGLEYESYLTGIGRQLFYIVAGSYLSIYLGVLFLIIANSVLGLKFLMQQRSTRHRYETLLILGANEESLYDSIKTQIRTYFTLVVGVAVFSSIFGIASINNSFLAYISNEGIGKIMIIAGIAVCFFLLIELVYVNLIQTEGKREIHRLNNLNRE